MDKESNLKSLKEYKLREVKQAQYVPVLDKDPIYAADSLTKRDLKEAYTVLSETFEEIRKEEPYHEVLYDTVMLCRENFLWYSNMFKEIEKLLFEKDEFEIPFEKCPPGIHVRPPVVQQPFVPRTHLKEDISLIETTGISMKLPPINNYRITYILEDYDLEDFQKGGFPAWYLLRDTTVFEQYSEKTNTRVRIDFRNGEFSYYIAGASDNWKQIADVPLEMDSVVAALLFRSFSS